MSLLRERAIAVSLASTLRDLRPAAARAWLVRLTSVDSEPELKLFASQASAVRGGASRPTEVRRNARAVITAKRRGSAWKKARTSRCGRRAADWTVIGGAVSCRRREGSPVCFDPRPGEWCKPPCDGPGRTGHGYQRVPLTVTYRPRRIPTGRHRSRPHQATA